MVATRSITRSTTAVRVPLTVLIFQKRFLEYWSIGVTGRTQPYAQGDMLPRVDNTRNPIGKSTAAAASLTGNPNGIAYDTTNIFSATGYSPLEKMHYQSLYGITKHKIDPLRAKEGHAAAALMRELTELDSTKSLEYLWWARLLKDFPSLTKLCTPEFKKSWEDFYLKVLEVAHDDTAVTALAVPFVREQMQVNYVSYPLIWRFAERLGDALESAPLASRYEKRASRVAVERVTKLMLDTIADEPWANQETTSPLHVDVSSLRAWHEAGLW